MLMKFNHHGHFTAGCGSRKYDYFRTGNITIASFTKKRVSEAREQFSRLSHDRPLPAMPSCWQRPAI